MMTRYGEADKNLNHSRITEINVHIIIPLDKRNVSARKVLEKC